MEDSQSHYRRIGLCVAAVFILLAAVAVAGLIARPKTPLEWEQARAERMNPRWVSVEIRTTDNRSEYRQTDPIFVVARFSSTRPYTYKIEVAEGLSESAVDFLHLRDGQQVVLSKTAIVCCDSR